MRIAKVNSRYCAAVTPFHGRCNECLGAGKCLELLRPDTLEKYASGSYLYSWLSQIARPDPAHRVRYEDWGEEGWKIFESYSWCGDRLYSLIEPE